MIHQGKKLVAFVDDGFSLAPGQHGCHKTADLNILLLAILVRNADGIIFDESRLIVDGYFFIQKITKGLEFPGYSQG